MIKIDSALMTWGRAAMRLLQVCLIAIFFMNVTHAAQSPPLTGVKIPQVSNNQRLVKAERELRDYQQSRAVKQKIQRGSIPYGSETKAGLSVNTAMKTSSTIFFFDDAEYGVNGWTTETHNDTILWHQTTRDANSPTHSWWCGRESQGNYNTGKEVSQGLISPVIDLSAATGSVAMLFTENYVTERGWDFCMVDASTDGGASWTHLRGGEGSSPSGNSHGWKISSLDLSAYAGKQINIRFFFETGDSVANAFPGWFIDNMVVFDQSGLISGSVYFDMNQDGTLDNNERGLPGWIVSVTGPVDLTLPTNINGTFYLPLPLGSYQISEVIQSPWILTSAPAVWNVSLDSSGQNTPHVNFGNFRSGSFIRGSVFNDVNKDSIDDAGDSVLVDWWVELADSSGDWVDDTYTDSSGQYAFLILGSGRYLVTEFLDNYWSSSVPGGSTPQYTVNVPPADTILSGYNFGNYRVTQPPPGTGVIRGFVFNDLNHNDTLDDREPGLSGRFIKLIEGSLFLNQVATDSLGMYSFHNLSPGTYTVQLVSVYGWTQSVPGSAYTITLGTGETRDSVYFGSYRLPSGTIRGSVFNDLNRNGLRDTLEPGLRYWVVSANGPGSWSIHTVTDSQGNYELDNIVAGSHTVTLSLPAKWKETVPLSPYSIVLSDSQTIDSMNFGVYALLPGSISGMVFDDANANGILDSGEAGIASAEVFLGGTGVATVLTDGSGHYTLNNLWAGTYQARVIPVAHWRQTTPPLLQGYTINLGDEENRGSVNFGLVYDTTFNLAFRTVLPESIAYARDDRNRLGRSVPRKPNGSEATFTLIVPPGGMTGLHVRFSQAMDEHSLTVTHFPPPTHDLRFMTWEFRMPGTDTLAYGDSIVLYVRCNKPRILSIKQYWWEKGNASPATGTISVWNIPGNQAHLLYPMPNAINLIESIYMSGLLPPGVVVGIYGPHSVYHPRASSVRKSLVDAHGMPFGLPRCLGLFAYTLRPISRPQNTLPPSKGNNKLFTEALALKINILASDYNITPFGLGDLIFQGDPANPYNGLSVRKISAKLDTVISGFDPDYRTCLYSPGYFDTLYRTIRLIDTAFSGPFDTLSFAAGFSVAPARRLSDVPYLRLDTSLVNSPRTVFRRVMSRPEPRQFVLEQNYPNPFNPSTTIEFFLTQPSTVTMKVYNILGQDVGTLIERQQVDDGWNRVTFSGDALHLTSGVYFYRLSAETIPDDDRPVGERVTMVKKMLYLK